MGYFPQFKPSLKDKISIVMTDISTLHVDAIVNPTNPQLIANIPNTASYSIVKAAGQGLVDDLRTRPSLEYGQAIVTPSYKLSCNYIIHTAVPSSAQGEDVLRSCYRSCFKEFAGQYKESIAFPCIGTGVQGFSHEIAANIALTITREFLEADARKSNPQVKEVIFCVFSAKDRDIYQSLLPFHFTS
ncbi:unnamed protein product [Cunninghamella blakesleeana]